MDTEFASSLLAVIDTGSIAEAGRVQGLTASAVSQRVRALEAALGLRLLVRSGRSVSPTPEALMLVGDLRAMVAAADRVRRGAGSGRLAGPFRLGAISTVLGDDIPEILRRARTDLPELNVSVLPGASADLFQALGRGALDMVLIVTPPVEVPKALALLPLTEQPLCLVTPAATSGVDLPWLAYAPGSWGGALCWRAVRVIAGDAPDVMCELDAPETIARMVAGGIGRAVLPMWRGLTDIAGLDVAPLAGPGRGIAAVMPRPIAGHPMAALVRDVVSAGGARAPIARGQSQASGSASPTRHS